MKNQLLAARCDAAKRYRLRQKGEDVPLQKRGPKVGSRFKIRHGTANEYGKHGCRCTPCKEAATARSRKYRMRDPEKNRAAVKRNQQVNIAIMRAAKDKPCTDCGVSYPYWVMQFDHLRDKELNLSVGESRSIGKARLLAEIAKCEVVCANCHMERTHSRLIS